MFKVYCDRLSCMRRNEADDPTSSPILYILQGRR